MSPLRITLQVGLNSLTIDPTGITLMAGANMLTVTPQNISLLATDIDLTAFIEAAITAGMVRINS